MSETSQKDSSSIAAPEEHKPLEGIPLFLITFASALATFMMILDTSIANVAVPTIAGNLGVSTDQGTWVITAFGAANAISMPLTGFLSRRFGEVRWFLIAIIGFIFSSLMCGLSTSMGMLIFFRVLQGGISGAIAPLSQSLLLRSYPPERHAQAMALWSMTVVVAPIMGPILGGYLTDNYAWTWIFLINVPIGIIAALIVFFVLRHRETNKIPVPINYIGIGLLVLAAGSLQIMLDLGKQYDWFSSEKIVLLGFIAIASWGCLIIWEWYNDHPVVNFKLFKSRNFVIATFLMCVGYMVFFGATVLLPLWLQGVMHYTSFWSGLAVAPTGVLAIIGGMFSAKIVKRFDIRYILTYAFSVFAIVGFWRANFTLDSSYTFIMLPQLLLGAATMFFFLPLQRLIVSGFKPDQVANAVALSTFFRTLTGSFSASIITTMWDNRMEFHHARIAENITVFNPQAMDYLDKMGGSLAALNGEVTSQAYMMSTSDIFYLSGFLCLMLIPIVWAAKTK